MQRSKLTGHHLADLARAVAPESELGLNSVFLLSQTCLRLIGILDLIKTWNWTWTCLEPFLTGTSLELFTHLAIILFNIIPRIMFGNTRKLKSLAAQFPTQVTYRNKPILLIEDTFPFLLGAFRHCPKYCRTLNIDWMSARCTMNA